MYLCKNRCINPSNILIHHETLFLSQFTLLYIAHIEQENNVDVEFTEDVRTFLMSDC